MFLSKKQGNDIRFSQ